MQETNLLSIATIHFAPNSTTFENKFAESAFFRKLIRYYQEEHNLMSEWMRNTKIESCATLQETICFLSPPSIWPPTVLPSRKNSLSFFRKIIRYYQEEHNLMSEWMRNILPPTVLPLRKNSLSQHFIEKLIRYYQEEHHLMSWMRNTKIDCWQHCRRPSAFYRHHPFGPQQYYLRE